MKKSFFLVVVLGLMLITFTGTGNAQKNCEDLLGDTVYSCEVKNDTGETFPECLRFNSTAPTTGNFDLVVDGLSSNALGCSCKATGSFKKPKFDASKEWVCVTADRVGPNGYTWWGKVASSGKIIKVSRALSENRAFYFAPQSYLFNEANVFRIFMRETPGTVGDGTKLNEHDTRGL